MHKRILRTRQPAVLQLEAEKLTDVTVRRSRKPDDPTDCYVIEGPETASRAIDKLVQRFDEGASS